MQDAEETEKLSHQFPFKHIAYVPNGFENTVPSSKKYPPRENTILFVGRASAKQKRLDLLVTAFRNLHSSFPDWKLKIIGEIDPTHRSLLTELSVKLGGTIEITGPISDRKALSAEYQKAKIFCLPSDFESFGLVTAEAIYHGCTIVGSDIPPTCALLNNETYGLLFKTGDAKSLEKSLKRAIEDQKLQSFCQKNGKKYIEKNFSYESSLKPLARWLDN